MIKTFVLVYAHFDFCLFLALEKCNCLAIYNHFSDGAEIAPAAQSGGSRTKVAGSKPWTFVLFMNLSRHCY